MKTLSLTVKQANKGPAKVDNYLMIVAADGDYLAQIDASEGRKWRASAELMVHGFNNIQMARDTLATALEVISDCEMPKTYHRTKADVVSEIVDALAKINLVKEIGEFS